MKRFNNALHLMKNRVRVEGQLWWLTTAKGSSRDAIAAIQKRVTRLQSEHDLWGYNALVFETRPKLHAHIVFIGNSTIAERLKRKVEGLDPQVAVGLSSHFKDLCDLLGVEKPTDVDQKGDWYCFERGASKTVGGESWADVWKRGHFGWEYKGKRKDLKAGLCPATAI